MQGIFCLCVSVCLRNNVAYTLIALSTLCDTVEELFCQTGFPSTLTCTNLHVRNKTEQLQTTLPQLSNARHNNALALFQAVRDIAFSQDDSA